LKKIHKLLVFIFLAISVLKKLMRITIFYHITLVYLYVYAYSELSQQQQQLLLLAYVEKFQRSVVASNGAISSSQLRQWTKLIITFTPRMCLWNIARLITARANFARSARGGRRRYVPSWSRNFAEKHISILYTLLLLSDASRNIYMCRRIFYSQSYRDIVAISSISPSHFRRNTTKRNADTDDRWEVEAAILSIDRTWKTISGNNTCRQRYFVKFTINRDIYVDFSIYA